METTIKNEKLTPKFFFISLGVIVTLITSVSSFLILFFETLNYKFPDVLNSIYQYGYNIYSFDSIRSSLATLIIFFPAFVYVSYLWVKESREDIGHVNMTLRKWMIYLILFLATLLIVIDLVTLVRYFISGEITVRFILKVIGTLAVGTLVDFFYSQKMSSVDFNSERSKKTGHICGIIATFFVLGIIVWSFMIMGSPTYQRNLRLDQKRVDDLNNIQSQVINFYQQKGNLPVAFLDLTNPISGYSIPFDPEFAKGKIYEYIPTDVLSFQLCSTFTTLTPQGPNMVNVTGPALPVYDIKTTRAIGAYPNGVNDSWNHGVGRTCFSRTIDPTLYPVVKK